MGWFDDYLRRAQGRKVNNMSMTGSKPYLQALSLENQQLKNTIEGSMALSGNPGMASEALRRQADVTHQSQSGILFNQERARVEERNQSIDDGIDQAIFRRNEERRAAKKKRKDGLLKTGLQIGGAALGAVVGSIVPGAGTMIGAQLGASLGGTASGFVGGGGKVGMNYANPDEIMAGVQDTISGISSTIRLKSQQNDLNGIGDLMKGITSASPEQKPILMERLKLIQIAMSTGNMPMVRQLLAQGGQQ